MITLSLDYKLADDGYKLDDFRFCNTAMSYKLIGSKSSLTIHPGDNIEVQTMHGYRSHLRIGDFYIPRFWHEFIGQLKSTLEDIRANEVHTVEL
jgi:hypothetical protein